MNATVRRTIAALSTTAALSCLALPAQDVLLSEVCADAGGPWVELHNRSAATVDLSSWSLHLASRTVGMPQSYWWAFPTGTTLPAGGFLRVHWFQAWPTAAAPGELYTGNSVWDFLFSLGGEPLRADRGALGLFRSQLDSMMNTSSIVEDWVSWGDHGFVREPLAITNGRWTAGSHTPAIAAGTSLARNTGTVGSGLPHAQQWFTDSTPTPLQPNLSGAGVAAYGQGCAATGHHLLGVPTLRAPSLPLIGNAQFRLELDHTTGIYGEHAFVAWSAGARPAGAPSLLPPVVGGCAESIDPWQLVAMWLLPTQVITTVMPLSLAGLPPELAGTELHVQAMVVDLLPFTYPPYQGLSNALHVTLGQ